MNAVAIIHMLGAAGIFPSRAFIPAFATAMLLRFGPEFDVLKDCWVLRSMGKPPEWFVHDATLILLGLLALLETIATKSQDIREFLNQFDKYVKPAMATLVAMGVLSASDADLAQAIQKAGVGALFGALLYGFAIYVLSSLRAAVLDFFHDADEQDDLGLQGLMAWCEDLWAWFGFLLLILYPLVMLGLVAFVTLGLYLVRRALEYREDQSRQPCPDCQTPVYSCAIACPKCGRSNKAPRAIGFFGSTQAHATPDLAGHPRRLAEKRRCPTCATRLKERSARQRCEACQRAPFSDATFTQSYIENVGSRLPKALGVSLLCSLVPVVGVIPGVVYYRMNLVAPFRRYVPWSIGCLVKWAVRLLVLVMILLQIVPVLGALMLPLMALLEYFTYRGIFAKLEKQPAPYTAATDGGVSISS